MAPAEICWPVLTHQNQLSGSVQVLIINWASGGGKGKVSFCSGVTPPPPPSLPPPPRHHHHPRDPQRNNRAREDSPGDLIIFCYFLYTHNQPDPVEPTNSTNRHRDREQLLKKIETHNPTVNKTSEKKIKTKFLPRL